jgi:glycosyltransferase involved in cell wall biosynthesis
MLVTAVVTTYNRPEPGRRAIRSVLAQTYGPLQIIVVEDGSDSGIEAWLKREGLHQVEYARHPENRGLAAARNTGLRLAAGEYVAYLDDDDEWKPQRIDRQVRLLTELSDAEQQRLGVVYCGVEVRASNRSHPLAVMLPRFRGSMKEAIVRNGPTTLSSTFLFSKAALKRAGGFDEALPSSIDHDIWMALASRSYEAHTVDEPLVIARVSSGGTMTTSTTARIRGVEQYLQKWKSTYREWLGDAEGEAYARQYLTRVIGRLAAEKLVNARLGEALEATRALLKGGGSPYYSISSLLKFVALAAARRLLPRGVLPLLKRATGRSR